MPILDHFKVRFSQSLIPMQATLELTYRCNERCSHCYLETYDDSKDGRPPMDLEEWKKVLDQLSDAGTLMLVLIGGEAMLYKNFWPLAEYGAKKNFALSLITNGLLVDDAAADRLADLGFYNVSLSLYSLDPAIHDSMTQRKGSHKRTIAAIERLTSRNVQVGINCLLTGENIDDYPDLDEWCRSQGLKIQYDPMVTPKSNGDLTPTHKRASKEQFLKLYRTLAEMNRPPAPAPRECSLPDLPVCNAGRGKCAVNAYGDLLTCLEIREPLGNLRQRSFRDLWTSHHAEHLRGLRNRDLQFDPQEGEGRFANHCQGVARAEAGGRNRPVPFLMEIAKVQQQVWKEYQAGHFASDKS